MASIVLYPLLTTAAYYLFARAMITRWLWSRYPAWLDYYTTCAACSGFLYGVVVAVAFGWSLNVPLLGLPGKFWLTPLVSGLGSMVWTPVLANLHVTSLIQLGVSDPRSTDEAVADVTPEQVDP